MQLQPVRIPIIPGQLHAQSQGQSAGNSQIHSQSKEILLHPALAGDFIRAEYTYRTREIPVNSLDSPFRDVLGGEVLHQIPFEKVISRPRQPFDGPNKPAIGGHVQVFVDCMIPLLDNSILMFVVIDDVSPNGLRSHDADMRALMDAKVPVISVAATNHEMGLVRAHSECVGRYNPLLSVQMLQLQFSLYIFTTRRSRLQGQKRIYPLRQLIQDMQQLFLEEQTSPQFW